MINTAPPSFANSFSPISPVGKLTVGEESHELKDTPLKAVEESAELARPENRRDRVNASEQQNSGQIQGSGQQTENEQELRDNTTEQQRLEEDKREISQLAARDREVRAHEQAHSSVGGQFTGAPQFTFTRGPDGVSYAVAGEVSIDTSGVSNDPAATIAKAEQIQRAALAPSEPSPQDRRVAAAASQLELNARVELREQQQEKIEETQEQTEDNQAVEQNTGVEGRGALAQDDDDANEAESERIADANRRNVDINQRLINIGVTEPTNRSGELLDQIV